MYACMCVCVRARVGRPRRFCRFPTSPLLTFPRLASPRLSSSRLGDGHLCEATGSNGTQWTIRVGAYERAHTRSRQRVHTRVHTPSISRLIDAGEKRPTRTESIFLLLLLSLSLRLSMTVVSLFHVPLDSINLSSSDQRGRIRENTYFLLLSIETLPLLLVNSVVLRCY